MRNRVRMTFCIKGHSDSVSHFLGPQLQHCDVFIQMNFNGSNDSLSPGFEKMNLRTFPSVPTRKVKEHTSVEPDQWQIPLTRGHMFQEHSPHLSHGVHILVGEKHQMLSSREGTVATWNGTCHLTSTEHVPWNWEHREDQLLGAGSDRGGMERSSRKKKQKTASGLGLEGVEDVNEERESEQTESNAKRQCMLGFQKCKDSEDKK